MRALLAVLLILLVASNPASGQRWSAVDARAEVASALYASSATQAAAERAADAEIRTQAAEIERLRREGQRNRAAITELEERYVSALAQRDRAYAQEISVFRRAVEDIASTPEGASALAQFNNGRELDAIAILDQLIRARQQARQIRANIESAMELRRVAQLANEARKRGLVDTAATIARFEEVTHLDPSEFWDHIELCRLYTDVGRIEDARNSGLRAWSLASEPRQQMVAAIDYADVLSLLGDHIQARRLYEASLPVARNLLAANSTDYVAAQDVSVALSRLGDNRMEQGLFLEAVPFYNEALSIDQEQHQRTRLLVAAQAICNDQMNLTDVIVSLNDLPNAEIYGSRAVRICEWVASQSSSGEDALRVAYARWRYGNIRAAQGDIQFARDTFNQLRQFADAALSADPSNARIALEVNLLELGFADLDLLEGNSADAVRRVSSAIEGLRNREASNNLNSLARTYVWLAGVRLASIPNSGMSWTNLRTAWESGSLQVSDFSAMDHLLIRRLREADASRPN